MPLALLGGWVFLPCRRVDSGENSSSPSLALAAVVGRVPRAGGLWGETFPGEVIRRLRLLLKKGEVRQQPLDVNAAVQEILKLVRSDLVIHGVTAQTELAPDLPMIHADPVRVTLPVAAEATK